MDRPVQVILASTIGLMCQFALQERAEKLQDESEKAHKRGVVFEHDPLRAEELLPRARELAAKLLDEAQKLLDEQPPEWAPGE